jgi:hypothetical protein
MGGNGPAGKLLNSKGPKGPKGLRALKLYRLKKNYNHEIYKLTCSNGNFHWTTLPQTLKIGRTEFVAIPIPDSLANCK